MNQTVSSIVKTRRHLNFTSEASRLVNKELYISATRLVRGTREFCISQAYPPIYSKQTEEYFKGGKEKHENYQKDIKTLEEYGYIEFRRDLHLHKEIKLKEVKVLSSKHYLYGIIDVVTIFYDRGRNLNIVIDELKSSWSVKHFIQLIVYGLILSDDNARLVYEIPYKRKKGYKRIMGYLFPDPQDIRTININGRVMIFGREGKTPYEQIVFKNEFTPQYANLLMMVLKRIYFYRELIRRGKVDISLMPHDKKRYCCKGGWGHICQKIEYKPNFKQRYLGKNKLLVKNKPWRI